MKATSEQIFMAAATLLRGDFYCFGAKGVKEEDIKTAIGVAQHIAELVPETGMPIDEDDVRLSIQEILSVTLYRKLTRLALLDEIGDTLECGRAKSIASLKFAEKSELVWKFSQDDKDYYCLKQDLIDADKAAKTASENSPYDHGVYYTDFEKALNEKKHAASSLIDLAETMGIIKKGGSGYLYVGFNQK